MILRHSIPKYCHGEQCLICHQEGFEGVPATHRVEETIFDDDPTPIRHPLTNYVCCFHFKLIFPVADC